MAADYLAMGSSFAAGPGLMPRSEPSPRESGRSASNYAHLLAARLGLGLDDQTFSGATISEIAGLTTAKHPAQIGALRETTKLVTITGGGNDVGYLPRLTLDSLPWFVKFPSSRRRRDRLGDPTVNDRAFEELRASLTTLIRTIHERSDAVVVVTDYLTILPPDSAADLSPLSPSVAEWGRRIAQRLTEPSARSPRARGPSSWRFRAHPSTITPGPRSPGPAGSISRFAAVLRTIPPSKGWPQRRGSSRELLEDVCLRSRESRRCDPRRGTRRMSHRPDTLWR